MDSNMTVMMPKEKGSCTGYYVLPSVSRSGVNPSMPSHKKDSLHQSTWVKGQADHRDIADNSVRAFFSVVVSVFFFLGPLFLSVYASR